MSYDPFRRGPHPAGVRSADWDGLPDGPLAVEVWYPAGEQHAGTDLDEATQDRFPAVWAADNAGTMDRVAQTAVRDATPAAGRFPLVLLPHGLAGYRREATFVGTHLASHGYLVVAADHRRSTFGEVDAYLREAQPNGEPRRMSDLLAEIAVVRLAEVPFVVERAIAELPVDEARGVGITGASFGGWTSLMGPSLDGRIRAVVPMCPGGGRSPIPSAPGDPVRRMLADHMAAWPEGVKALMLVADRDSWLPLHGQLELFARLPAPARMVILRNADHNHFVDDIPVGHEWIRTFTAELATRFPEDRWGCIARDIAPYDELMPAEQAYATCRGLTVAHFDAILKQDAEATAFWQRDVRATMADHGIEVELVSRP